MACSFINASKSFVMGLFKKYGELCRELYRIPLRGKLFFGPIVLVSFVVELIVTIVKFVFKVQVRFPTLCTIFGVLVFHKVSEFHNPTLSLRAWFFLAFCTIGVWVNLVRNEEECCRHGKGFLQ